MSETPSVAKQVSTVFSIAQTLRGTYQADKYRDVIIPMVILRRVECALAKTKDAVCEAYEANPNIAEAILRRKSGHAFYNTSRWTLSKLLGDPANLDKNLPTYIDAFPPISNRSLQTLISKKTSRRCTRDQS